MSMRNLTELGADGKWFTALDERYACLAYRPSFRVLTDFIGQLSPPALLELCGESEILCPSGAQSPIRGVGVEFTNHGPSRIRYGRRARKRCAHASRYVHCPPGQTNEPQCWGFPRNHGRLLEQRERHWGSNNTRSCG